ncbi:uncharacterized protein METZ01_LOCUS162585, partial [marine metagenome]
VCPAWLALRLPYNRIYLTFAAIFRSLMTVFDSITTHDKVQYLTIRIGCSSFRTTVGSLTPCALDTRASWTS